ncbi:MAG: hypothetical protein L0H79_08770 [Intrasporangium sp.]|uniref:hypothetical protein n=1 Tax=Intrasporangium sp. TaxID=1925024 RepID=UPI00264946B5|nr:hypothetical protein [Intrasporangium sp.]MDN5795828.1 hypothetical protein [Intrasporangium sp.]
MDTAQDLITSAQAQALEAIRSGQAAAVEAVQAWGQAVAKFTPQLPTAARVPAGAEKVVGDPAAIVDSVYDFAAQLMDLNKQFVHSLLEAGTAATEAAEEAPAAKPAAKKA